MRLVLVHGRGGPAVPLGMPWLMQLAWLARTCLLKMSLVLAVGRDSNSSQGQTVWAMQLRSPMHSSSSYSSRKLHSRLSRVHCVVC
jgi:hypothetical protein